MRSISVLLLATCCGACGSDAGGRADAPAAPDAPVPDAGSPVPDAAKPLPDAPLDAAPTGPLERLDFRDTRGPRLATTTARVPAGDLYALYEQGFVTTAGCTFPGGCTFTWFDEEGRVQRQRDKVVAVAATSASMDGRYALLLAADEVGTCGDDPESRPLVGRGTLQVLDLATAAPRFELALRTQFWSEPAFTPDSAWFFAAPVPDGQCRAPVLGRRSVVAPFGSPPGLGPEDELREVVDAHRWIAWRGTQLMVLDPFAADPDRGTVLAEGIERWDATDGWIHVYDGYSDLVQEVVSLHPTLGRKQTTLRDQDWWPFGASGRWVRVCGFLHSEHYRSCRVVDVLGEHAPVDFKVRAAPGAPEDAVLLGASGAVVFVDGDPAAARAVERIDLATGRRDRVLDGDARLRPLGAGAAALVRQDDRLWLVEADHQELVAEHVSGLLSMPSLAGRARVRQDDLAVVVTATEPGAYTLTVLDLATRRLAMLTDRLDYAPHDQAPFAFDDCGQPWITRVAGWPSESLGQNGRYLFFVEQATAADPGSLWLLPVDLSAAPRRLATLSHPVYCNAPLATADGSRVAFLEDGIDGTAKVTMARP
jgi:hypothetical protein